MKKLMNQILSVEMPKSNIKNNSHRETKKASTKTIVLFFCIVLLIFGISLIGIALFSLSQKKENENTTIQEDVVIPVEENGNIRIEASQNETGVQIDVTGENEIVSVYYSWNDEEKIQGNVNGTNSVTINIDKIPSGTNTLNINVTDSKNNTQELKKEIIGQEKANVSTVIDSKTYKLNIEYQEEKRLKAITYKYNEEEEKLIEVDDNFGMVEIESRQGENKLTIKEIFEDGTTKQESKRIYLPIIKKVELDVAKNVVIEASDVRIIDKVIINLNGQITEINDIDSETFEQTIKPIQGENKLIIIVFNKDQGVTVKRVKWTNS